MSFCMKCGSEVAEGSKFCMKCGAPVEAAPVAEAPAAEPVVETPVVEAPVAEPIMETPVVEAPVAELVVEAPVAVPVVEPVMEQPAASQPMMEQQVTPVYGAIPQEPKKKSKKGLIAALISIGVVAILAIVLVVILLVAGGDDEVDISKYVSVEYEGYDTMGTADVILDSQGLVLGILEAQGEDTTKVTQNSISVLLKSLLMTLDYEISKDSDLSNGDKVEVVISYDKAMAEQCELEFTNTTISYTVEGLEALKEVDPFADITIEFSGTSGGGYAYYDNKAEIDEVRWSSFNFDKNDDLSNGDTIKLTVSEDSINYAKENGYLFTVTSKEYTVEGLSFYYASLDEITDEHMEYIKTEALNEINNEYAWKTSYALLSNTQYVGTFFIKDTVNGDSYNDAYIVYTGTITSPNNLYQPTEIYLPVKVGSLYVKNDGSISSVWPVLLGNFEVPGEYWTDSVSGYSTGASLYEGIFKDMDDTYEVESTTGMPDFETMYNDSLNAGTDTPVEGETPTGDSTSTEGDVNPEEGEGEGGFGMGGE